MEGVGTLWGVSSTLWVISKMNCGPDPGVGPVACWLLFADLLAPLSCLYMPLPLPSLAPSAEPRTELALNVCSSLSSPQRVWRVHVFVLAQSWPDVAAPAWERGGVAFSLLFSSAANVDKESKAILWI